MVNGKLIDEFTKNNFEKIVRLLYNDVIFLYLMLKFATKYSTICMALYEVYWSRLNY